MSTLNIPVPAISTGPKHMTDTQAAEHYLREMRDRTKMLQAGSGVTALVDRLLDDVLDAMEALNTSTDAPTPERVTLTDEERDALADSVWPAGCPHDGDSYAPCWDCAAEWVAAREQALREEVARDQHHRGQVVEALLEALGLTDDTTEEEARALLDGCDCNGEQGTLHLIHHLAARGGAR